MRQADLVGPLWETPDPPGVRGSYGPKVRRWAKRELGIRLGPWQAYVLDKTLRYGRRGDLLARTALWSTARQNGKSVDVRILLGWMLDEGRKLAPFKGWSDLLAAAHDAKQARIVYDGVRGDLEGNERLRQEVRLTRLWGIETKGNGTGGTLRFDTVTSQPGSARGRSAGLIAWDEMLTQRDWSMFEVLGPTQSAQRSPLMILTSTAGYADSVVLRQYYDRLQRIAAGTEEPDPTFYGAWWASRDPEAGLDWEQVRMANPALDDGRLSRAAIEAEFRNLPADSWRRERLNHFLDVRAEGGFNPAVWAACRVPGPLEGLSGPFALGVHVQPGWERAAIVVAARRSDGRIGVEVHRALDRLRDGPITAQRLMAEVREFASGYPVKVIAYEAISGFGSEFERDGFDLPLDPLKPGGIVAAAMDTTEMILSGRLAADDPLLDVQVLAAAKRAVGLDGAFRFNPAASLGPIEAVIAMTFAAHGAAYEPPLPNVY